MTAFYKFPDQETYLKLQQEEIPAVVLGYVPNGQTKVEVQFQEDGSEVEVEVPLHHEGFHVNTMKEVSGWSEYLVTEEPETPWMIFG